MMQARNRPILATVSWIGFVIATLILSSCDQQKAGKIQWQLPLSTSQDPHGANVTQNLPSWALGVHGSATIVMLHTITAQVFNVPVTEGQQSVESKGFEIQLLGLAQGLRIKSGAFIDDKNVHNPAAFVEIKKDGKLIYYGWLYQNFPELFGPDMVGWKIWVKDISIDQPLALSPGTTQGTRP